VVKYSYITVYANPTVSDSVINATGLTVADGSAFITVTSGKKPYSFAWSTGAPGDSLLAAVPGTYQVTVSDSNSCYVVDTLVISYSNGIGNLSADVQIKLYPNPANDILNFEWNTNSVAEVSMYNLTGALVKTYTCTGATLNSFDIHALAAGPYLIRITDKQNNTQHAVLFNKL
jgi:hypothetical protein